MSLTGCVRNALLIAAAAVMGADGPALQAQTANGYDRELARGDWDTSPALPCRLRAELVREVAAIDDLSGNDSRVHIERWKRIETLVREFNAAAGFAAGEELQRDLADLDAIAVTAIAHLSRADIPPAGLYANLLADAHALAQNITLSAGPPCAAEASD